MHPRPVVARHERLREQRLGESCRGDRSVRVVTGEQAFPVFRRFIRRDHVHPRVCGENEAVAPRRCREIDRFGAVGENFAELAGEHAERLIPARRRGPLPQRLSKLVPRHQLAVVGDEVGEEKPALSAGELFVDAGAVRLDGDAPREKDLQLALLTGF